MPSIESRERRRELQQKLLRKRNVGLGDWDMVAAFDHNRVLDPNRMRIVEHRPADDRRAAPKYTIKSDVSDNVVQIGNEVDMLERGYDYAVAVVDNRTGETTYRPARMFKFAAQYASDTRVLLGEKRKPPIDYSADYGFEFTDYTAKRNMLTQNFGSSKKMKMQDAAVKRTINEDTLGVMLKTAFASASVVKNPDEISSDQISMVKHAQSSILPVPVQAELPRDIYPLSLFITDEEMEAFAEVAIGYMKESKKKLVEAGFPLVVAKIMPKDVDSDPKKAISYTLLGCMSHFLEALGRSRSLLAKTVQAMPFPEAFIQKVQVDYLTTEYDRGISNRSAARMQVNSEQKERLMAYALALALTLSPGCSLPVTPWQTAFKVPPSVIEKLLVGLGCDVVQCNMEEVMKTDSMRAARLMRPPSQENKTGLRKKRR